MNPGDLVVFKGLKKELYLVLREDEVVNQSGLRMLECTLVTCGTGQIKILYSALLERVV